MIKLLSKSAFLCLLVAALSACGDKVDSNSETTASIESATLIAGKSNFDSSCSSCHGDEGDNIVLPIVIDNCKVADCSSIDSLASYISEFMPPLPSDPQSCSLDGEDSCAYTTAAYIMNGFSVEAADDTTNTDPTVLNVQTPLARLTNDEYVNSIRTLLNLADDSPLIEEAKTTLASESIVKGLTSDTTTQTLTQLAISGYSTMAIAASSDFLVNVESREELAELLACSTLVSDFNVSNQLGTCLTVYSTDLMSKAYRRPSDSEDTNNISEMSSELDALYVEYDKERFDIAAFKVRVQSILQYILLSPEFMLIVESGETNTDSNTATKELTDHEIATRMAVFLAGTLPDDELLADAEAGNLSDANVRLEHANRLMNSETGISQFTTLIENWLDIDAGLATTDEINTLSTFITDWFTDEGAFSHLYEGAVTVKHVDGTESSEQFGILGLKAFVASHTSYPTPSFINRGEFVVERLLCEALPEDLPDEALDSGDLTPLEVFEDHAQQACATCHKVFDNYGATFQQFDAETSLFDPTNQDFGSSFDLYDIGDITKSVSGLGELSFEMAHSERAPACMAELWYRHSMRRSIDEDGKDDEALKTLIDDWAASGDKSMKALLRSIVTSDHFITLYL